ncbi:MAG: tetratricopeptide repeat protein [Candidatus Lokiarchaeota archaeon]|nr:tetratricopeptide repeat protein [Candidatus Lokiarchaeota archaeon]
MEKDEKLKAALLLLENVDKNDNSKYNSLLNEISGLYFEIGEFNKAIEYINQAIASDIKVGDNINYANDLSNLGLILRAKNNFKEAIKSFSKAYELDKIVINDKKKKIHDLLNIGECNELLKQWDLALGAYNDALKEIPELKNDKDKETYIYISNMIGFCYEKQKIFENAIEFYKKGLEIGLELKNQIITETQYNNIGRIFELSGDEEKALESYKKAFEIAEKIRDLEGISIQFNNFGRLNLTKGEIDKALEYCQKALNIIEKSDNDQNKIVQYRSMALIYKKLKNNLKAIEYFEKMKNLALKYNEIPLAKSIDLEIEECQKINH